MSYILYWPSRKDPQIEIEVEGNVEEYTVLSVNAQAAWLAVVPDIVTEPHWDMFIIDELERAKKGEKENDLFSLGTEMMNFQREG